MTVADAIGETLAYLGPTDVFGVVGSGNFQVTNALIERGLAFTAARHEMGAVCMADAHSRLSDGVSLASVHQGCGLTNALTGVTEAVKSNSSVLVLSGDTASGDTEGNFYIDQDAAVAALGATTARINSADSAVQDTLDAFYRAKHNRTTVVLSMPVDIQSEYIDFDSRDLPSEARVSRPGASVEGLNQLVDLLGAAERPVIVAGRGALHAGKELRALADAAGALLATSAAARGLFVGDAWALDIMGGFGTEGASELISQADVLMAFGAGLNSWTTRDGELVQNKTVIKIDDRDEAFHSHWPADVGILGDSANVARAAEARVRKDYPDRRGYRTPAVREQVEKFRYWKDQAFTPLAEIDRVDPREVINALDHILPLERVVVSDGGNVNCYAGAHLRVPDERGYCFPFAFQSIGLGLATAIGAGIAQKSRLPVLGTGDGAFLMSLVELDTAVRLRMGMVIAVFNDSAYGAEVNMFASDTDQLGSVRFPETDIASIAQGYGCDGVTVRSLQDLDTVKAWLQGARDRPLVMDVKIPEHLSWQMSRRYGPVKR